MNQPENSAGRVLWAATQTAATPAWTGLHDQVMGGRSEGSARSQAGSNSEPAHVLFSGHISRENGGGFASFRLCLSAPVVMGAAQAAVLTLRGDGGPFKLCLHRQNDADGVQWQADLATPSQWSTQALSLPSFVSRRRGREVRERPLLADDVLVQIGLMTTRPDPGPFWLAVTGIALR